MSARNAVLQSWLDPESGWLIRIEQHRQSCQAHPAHTVVLLPYAQLIPLASRLWAELSPSGFSPRFETTQSWSRSLGSWSPEATDISQDTGLDLLTARALLERSGLGSRAQALTSDLLAVVQQLAPLAAAFPPRLRADWATQARAAVLLGLQLSALELEAALAQIAVEWAAVSAYPTDLLHDDGLTQDTKALVIFQGLQAEPLQLALASRLGQRCLVLQLDSQPESEAKEHFSGASGQFELHPTCDAEDEAQLAAACVLRHVNAGRTPVALVAIDRSLVRRVRALLVASGVALRDETGWKLSTSRAASLVMSSLRAGSWNASSDTVLDWLKNAPAFPANQVNNLERDLRRHQIRDWLSVVAAGPFKGAELDELLLQIEGLRQTLKGARTLLQWLGLLRTLLKACGQWTLLSGDLAGDEVLKVLHLKEDGASLQSPTLLDNLSSQRRLDHSEFSAWVNQVLEASNFIPGFPPQEQVVMLPMHQLLGRPFAAIVIPGCEEISLNPSPETSGHWTASQRVALGMPSRASLEAAGLAAWRQVLAFPHGDVLWRQSDGSGEALLPSPWVQALQTRQDFPMGTDPRTPVSVAAQVSLPPLPQGALLSLTRISATAYDDLRHCPYRFFALRQLGLKDAEELDSDLDKRDFGLWLHAVLKQFHEALLAQPEAELAERGKLIDQQAQAVTDSMNLDASEFLPFAAAWPRVRDGYLEWLAQHEATGSRFERAEIPLQLQVAHWTLVGTLDRVDRTPDGSCLVLDYKTETLGKTRDRNKLAWEDTQLAFYAALLPDDTLRAAYVNVGEKDGTLLFEKKEVVLQRDALIEGIVYDLTRVSQGVALPALGQGDACDFCAARGLCRKDFWESR